MAALLLWLLWAAGVAAGVPSTVPPPAGSISVPGPVPRPALTTPHPAPPRSYPLRASTIPPFAAPRTMFPASFTTPPGRKAPSYVPPLRASFTPPLPPGYGNPFADKPTLRGSNSDGGSLGPGRHQIPPPPRPPPLRERIPLRPQLPLGADRDKDSSTPERKKPLNTPSFNRSPEAPFSEPETLGTSVHAANDTELELLHSLSVSRILAGSNGRKQELPEIFRHPDLFPKVQPDVSVASTARGTPPPEPRPEPETPRAEQKPEQTEKLPEEEKVLPESVAPAEAGPAVTGRNEERVERLPDPQPQPPEPVEPAIGVSDAPTSPSRDGLENKWQIAWDIHVYLTASLFTLLSLYSVVNIVRVNLSKRLLSCGYYMALHGLVLTIGVVRSVYLFYDAYNLNRSFPAPISHLMLNVVSPLITSTFIILFLFLLQAVKVSNVLSLQVHRPALAVCFVVLHVCLCIGLDLAAGLFPTATFLPLICQSLFIVVCTCLGAAYLYAYQHLARAATRKLDNIFGSGFANVRRPALATAVRATLATALLALLMAAVQLYGIFGIYEAPGPRDRPVPWLWWGYQFSVRVIEIAMCGLLSWAGTQPLQRAGSEEEKESQNSGFALFRCGRCSNTPRSSEGADDIYPAVCVTNQAIHDYTIRTGKKVYDDSFPLNNLHSGYPPGESNLGLSTSERRSLRKSPYLPSGAGTFERHSLKKGGPYEMDDLPFPTSRARPELDAVYPLSSTAERRSLKRSGALEAAYGSAEARRSLQKAGTLASLSADRRAPVSGQHRGGTQTLSCARDRTSPSMLVAENGFVRFRALAEPEDAGVPDAPGR
ncbi:uncharacterized protein LOC134536219 [Bacillus rossius redtenbacheri]|uniref:uncharacterized protein LOC134536219 n=1 Tax=Bacillus rossius redtenbacheri TaxID=93214 RepID=UPI002FDD4C1F